MTMPAVPAANLRPENLLTQEPKAMYQASVLYTPPTLGYFWSWCAYYVPEYIPDMLKEVAETVGQAALETFEAVIKGMGVHEPGPEERLQLYRVKPVELWQEQAAKFPWRYEHDMQDWEKLEQEYGPEPPKTLPEVVE